MSIEEIKQRCQITDLVESDGYQTKQRGNEIITSHCPITQHKENHLCVNINPDKNEWFCNDCKKGGSVIEWMMLQKNISFKDAITMIGGDECKGTAVVDAANTMALDNHVPANNPATKGSTPESAGNIECTYEYTNENGQLLYQVVRYNPKSFRQRQPKGADWKWNLDGVTRVLYNLPKVLMSPIVAVTEGEKDADTLNGLGMVATTNACGSSAWLDAYAGVLKNKDVLVFPDNDQAGKKHFERILNSIKETANSVKQINVPGGHKDVSDWLSTIPEKEQADALCKLIDSTPHTIEPLPIYTVLEMESHFKEYVKNIDKKSFPMYKLAEGFRGISDNLGPGEVVMIVGDTGQGKTALMQQLARVAKPMPTLIFELELPLQKMYLRSLMMESMCYSYDVISEYKKDMDFTIADTIRYENMKHVMICPKSGISVDTIEGYVTKSELKFGVHPSIVMIDYMGLVRHKEARSRYEAMAYSAERAKVLAKNTDTVVIMGSQVSRPMGHKGVIHDIELHHAKGAGELENSANLVLGLARIQDNILRVNVIKNNDGDIGAKIYFDFDAKKLQIKENPNYVEA